MRRLVIFTFLIIVCFFLFLMLEVRSLLFMLIVTLALIALAIYDSFQRKHTILRNFPVIGHLRYIFELIRPEIRQYFIADDQEEKPFNREVRSIVYQRAKNVLSTIPFGTQRDILTPGYELIRHSLAPSVLNHNDSRILVGTAACLKPYLSSRLNVSAMSFGAISKNAIMALSKGAQLGNFSLNTGEGGLSQYHLEYGGDLIWQLGTALFGCRTLEGRFAPDIFQKKACLDQIKMIEVKLSQGAKPSHGGILPAVKITPEIAEIRGVPMGKDCLSPPTNPEFSTPEGLLYFLAQLRELSGGKPVGFKLCIGIRSEFLGICKAMLKTGILPDFITIDGAEGGTGAAPLEFADHIGETINDALIFVHNALVGIGVREEICLTASGKIATGFDMIVKMAIGADICNSARAMMFALGCIQALQCNKNTCPTGVTTQNPRLVRGLVIEDKYKRVASFHKETLESCLELAGAMGVKSLEDLNPWHVFKRMDNEKNKSYAQLYTFLEKGDLLKETVPEKYQREWMLACAEKY